MSHKVFSVRSALTLFCACCLTLSSWLFSPTALAVVPIRIFDISYEACPPEVAEGAVTSGGITAAANCFIISGSAENKSGRPVVDADVFGRIFDANNNPAMQNRSRVGSIEEVPPGISSFEMRISVPEDLALPLKLEQFKASGFSTKVR